MNADIIFTVTRCRRAKAASEGATTRLPSRGPLTAALSLRALLDPRRFSGASHSRRGVAWLGLACARVTPPDQIPVSIVGSACFYVSRVYCFLHRCCSSELHPGASQYFRAWSQYFLRLHLAHGDKPASIFERKNLGASCRQCRLKPSGFTGGCVVLTEALS